MPRPRVRVKVEGIEELAAKLQNPRLIEDPLRELMDESTKVGQKAAVLAVDGGSGKAVQSIGRNVRIDRRGSQVYSAMSRETVRSIDQGRRPAPADWKFLIPAMTRWARAVGYGSSIFALAKKVATNGTRGKKFLAAGRKAVAEALPELTAQMGRRVEGQWRR